MKKINWRYAIGELLIVTAGITLAFMLNSWAENNRINEKRKIYLEGVVQDLEADKALLDSTILESQRRLNVLYGLMPYLNGKTAGRDSVFFGFFKVVIIIFAVAVRLSFTIKLSPWANSPASLPWPRKKSERGG